MENRENVNPETLPLAVERYVAALGNRIREVLGEQLTGAYLHGSAVLGGFNPARSDIDVLVVVRKPLVSHTRRELGDRISETSLPCPARGLELSVVTTDAAQHPTADPPYELHVNTYDQRLVEDDGHGDPDLVLHFLVCRRHGRPLGRSLERTTAFGSLPRSVILRRFRAELEWAINDPTVEPRYIVLSAARNWYFLETSAVASKIAAGRWALEHVADPAPVRTALESQGDVGPDPIDADPAAARKFAASVVEKIDRTLEDEMNDDR
jgi:hypothetical protein